MTPETGASNERAGQPEKDPAASRKTQWEEPKLDYVEPKLTEHGNLEKVTGSKNGFFGQFSP